VVYCCRDLKPRAALVNMEEAQRGLKATTKNMTWKSSRALLGPHRGRHPVAHGKPWGRVPLHLIKPRKGRHQACTDSLPMIPACRCRPCRGSR
jgi:hypothetical protein